ncbi:MULTISPECIES: citrate synthase [Roseivirga]|jgi:citrate synthase|uniref:Citrate synthase n=1 Tax=Roseivirga spongicola TaxID=333140 RepID=A0A150X4T1_9BACT|nr:MULTISPECIES: citrate synthase [Roseivirga]PWL31865.1 MAG: citrate synthase [Roseivirga sp. XM-24bin3]KYG73725.1 type II citrate synthase [Roseivirga spongicola]MBO6496758.1 citrate synthase [Roseivirga sp.]MBO6660007.1 citrate synthase [Roseivirga sp.]MBO6907256.1 citrate synthase [Roseivirga sp.]
MSNTAEIKVDGKSFELPVVEGTENEKAIDISSLRGSSGVITIDPGFKNTGSTTSAITFLDGEKGILRYRGYSIEDLAEKSTFLEVAYLLIYGELPDTETYNKFVSDITNHTLVHEDVKKILEGFPSTAHPMGVLSSLVCAQTAFYPASLDPNRAATEVDMSIIRLIAKMPTFAAWSYKNQIGHPVNYPDNKLDYCGNFLKMMFANPAEAYEVDPVVANALDKLLILHADHEQNCSTSTVRIVGSSHASLYASISGGINALWGPLHGGANQAVIEMLENIRKDGGDTKKWMAKAKDKNDPFRLMGFGHRVYKNFDPRAKIIKKAADDVLEKLGVQDPVLDIAKGLEEEALNDQYFVDRKLYPNVDFYSGIIYRALGIPTDMFTVMFAMGRLPGWIAQWKEMRENKEPIGRPRQVYTGANLRPYVSLSER